MDRKASEISVGRRVLLVGWDSADWKVINPLMDAGKLPHLEQLVNGGVLGNLSTLYPVLSPMLWTSIATGKRPMKHGIHGFAEPDPHGGGVRPITNLSRKTKAVWNILAQNGKKCIVVGWWPSHPAEPLPGGVMVSNHYQRAPQADPSKPWPMAPGTVYPARLAEPLTELRVHPAELDGAHILPFVPKAAEVDQEKDRRLEGLAKMVADCSTIHAAATNLIRGEPWDFMAVYFDAIDHLGHGFMRYHPPRQKWIKERDFELYSGVIEAGYRYHDMMLGVLMALAGPETTILLMSDHGFHPDHLRPSSIPIEPAGPAVEHRQYGIFALKGPGIKKDERVYGATVLDICPTLLSLFDLPIGQDMDGKPLVTIFSEPPKLQTITSWDELAGDDGCHPSGTRLDPGQANEALKQLEALGYIEPLPEDAEQAIAECDRELRYNLACAHTDANQPAAAEQIFSKLWREQPQEHRFGAKLIATKLALGRLVEARSAVEQLRANRKKYGQQARAQLKDLREKVKNRKPKDMSPAELRQLRRLSARASLSPVPMMQLEAMLLLAEKKAADALEILKKLEKAGRRHPEFHLQMARCCVGLKNWSDAEVRFQKALELDPEHANAHFGLAQVRLAQRRNFEAAGAALTSIGLLYHHPQAHFCLGVALHRLGKITRAVEALRVCVAQNPNFLPAHRRLALIYEKRLKQPEKAKLHRSQIHSIIERRGGLKIASGLSEQSANEAVSERRKEPAPPTVFDATQLQQLPPARQDAPFGTIVSGLPRSGTSLMMQMLAAGGLPPLQDGHRPADIDNPRGYFEFAPAKNLRADGSWIEHTKGRALKVVAQLLPFLPPGQEYRVVLMERSAEEVLASQQAMVRRRGENGAGLAPEKLWAIYEQQLTHVREILQRRRVPVLPVAYSNCLTDPTGVSSRIRQFLNLPLSESSMAAAVDQALYRQKQEHLRVMTVPVHP